MHILLAMRNKRNNIQTFILVTSFEVLPSNNKIKVYDLQGDASEFSLDLEVHLTYGAQTLWTNAKPEQL